MDTTKKLYRVKEAAPELSVSEKTLWTWIYKRQIGFVRIGRSVRIPQSEIDRLLEENFTPALQSA